MFLKKQKFILFTIAFLISLFVFSGFASAQENYGLEYSSILELGTRGLKSIIFMIINVMLGFLGILAIAIVLYGGFIWMTSGGAPEKIEKAKKILISGAIGLLIILASFAISQFIMNSLMKATGGGGSGTGAGGGGGGGALGAGIIESVYPAPGALAVARNTSIIVTFKEAMDPSTLIDDINGDSIFGNWRDDLGNNDGIMDAGEYDTIVLTAGKPNVKIAKKGELISGPYIIIVFAATVDNKTFRFKPIDPLGSSTENIWHSVELTNNINKSDGTPAFGAFGSYDWSFEISTFLDTTPPYIKTVQPTAGGTYDRNIVVQMHFSEAIDPLSVLSDNILVKTGGIKLDGAVCGNDNECQSGDCDDVTLKCVGDYVSGNLYISNQYKTVEFLGTPCGINSCGDTIYCLPGNSNINTTIKAATLISPPDPEAIYPFDGIVDMASNSFDGNHNGVSNESPADDYAWSFNTTNNINLTPPTISSVNPPVDEKGVTLKDPIQILFSDIMMYSSLNTSNIGILGGTIGYWITAEDITGPPDQTMAYINHYKFSTATTYQSQATAGIKNNYQNCLYPSEGPGCACLPIPAPCPPDPTKPCCCDGVWCVCPCP